MAARARTRRRRAPEADEHDEHDELDDADLDDEHAARGARRRPASVDGLAVGFLAMVPLFCAYEAAVLALGGERNAAEVLLTRPLEPLGDAVAWIRRVAFVAVALVAFAHLRRTRRRIGAPVVRVGCEGLAAAMALGPVLLVAGALLPLGLSSLGLPSGPPATPPGAAHVALAFGAGAYEELVFRVGAFSLLFVLARESARFFGAPPRGAEWVAEAVALAGSSLAFAVFHLEGAVAWLGDGGEPFDATRFAWRTLAGALLAVLFRWRGLGVAAWAHALFNASLLLGAGPGVLAPM